MIVYPDNWEGLGQPISLKELDTVLQSVLMQIDCDCLSYSGGIDSSLLLYYLLTQRRKVRTFTVASSPDHPDIQFARSTIYRYEQLFATTIEAHVNILPNLQGDRLVKVFYHNLKRWTEGIIAGDGIDEFMAGYYAHQEEPTEDMYYEQLRRLKPYHLRPLHLNSGAIKVYLPYLAPELVSMMCQIPLSEKADASRRKQIIVALAQGKVPLDIIERRKYGFGTAYVGQDITPIGVR